MTKEIMIQEDLESRFFKGDYRPGKIRIRPNLNTCEKALTLKHEMAHHKFYQETTVGRICALFFDARFTFPYMATMFTAWLFFPAAYVFLIVLPIIDRTHELLVSVKFPSRISFTLSVLVVTALLGLFWLRLRV